MGPTDTAFSLRAASANAEEVVGLVLTLDRILCMRNVTSLSVGNVAYGLLSSLTCDCGSDQNMDIR